MNKGVETVLARMESNPEEFFTSANDKWKFIYSEYFRDAMTETEKGLIFDKIKEIRREELTQKVMATLLPLEDKEEQEESKGFGNAPIMHEGRAVKFSSSDAQMAKQLKMSPTEYLKYKRSAGL